MPLPLLPSSTLNEKVLAEYGAHFVAQRLYDGGKKIVTYASEATDQAILGPLGFNPPYLSSLGLALEDLNATYGSRVQTQADARPSGASSDAQLHVLEDWVNTCEGRIHATTPALENVPRLKSTWHLPAHAATEVQPLLNFTQQLVVQGQSLFPQAFLDAGKKALQDFSDARGLHVQKLDALAPGVFAMHRAEGVVAMELDRLARVAKHVLPHERAHLYRLNSLRSGHDYVRKTPPAPAGQGGATPA